MRTNRYLRRIGIAIAIALTACPPPGLAPTTWANDASEPEYITPDTDRQRPLRVDLEFGYFTARRETFRQLYGSDLSYAVSVQRSIIGRFDLSLRAEYIPLAENGPTLKYRVGSLTPMLLYALPRQAGLQPVIGAGLGLTKRRVLATAIAVDELGDPQGEVTVIQTEWNVCIVTTAGLDIDVSERLILGARTYFDYFPSGDPTAGDFGDTGGFHFVGRLGFKL